MTITSLKPLIIGLLLTNSILLARLSGDDSELRNAIEKIGDPDVPGELKHVAFVTLQELKDPRSIQALYEEIDFASAWGSQTQRTIENSFPATRALVLIGEPSIAGATIYINTRQNHSDLTIWLITYVIHEINRLRNEELSGESFPKANAQTLEWLKENYTEEQMRIVSKKFHMPLLKEYLASFPVGDHNSDEPGAAVEAGQTIFYANLRKLEDGEQLTGLAQSLNNLPPDKAADNYYLLRANLRAQGAASLLPEVRARFFANP